MAATPRGFDSKTTHYAHQLAELRCHAFDTARAWFWQMRSGKSKTAIDNATSLWLWGFIDAVVGIAPTGVHAQWLLKEVPRHSAAPWLGMVWQSDKVKSKWFQRQARQILDAPKTHLPWVMLNNEALRVGNASEYLTTLLSRKRCLLLVDESHNFRTPGASMTKALIGTNKAEGLASAFPFRRILTGTPVANSPMGLWSQFEILGRGSLGFDTHYKFKHRYATWGVGYRTGGTYEKCEGFINLEELRDSMAPYASVITRADCTDLPPLIQGERYHEMTTKQARVYRELSQQFLAFLDSGTEVSAIEGGARLVKLMQVLTGWVGDDEKNLVTIVPVERCPRLAAVRSILQQETDRKVIVWCRHRHDIERVRWAVEQERGAGLALEYHGKVTKRKRAEVMDKMETQPWPYVFIGTPHTAGTGLNLGSARHIIWFSHVHDVTLADQASERATEIGTEPVVVTNLCVPGTVEEAALQMLKERRSLADELAGEGLKEVLRSMVDGSTQESTQARQAMRDAVDLAVFGRTG